MSQSWRRKPTAGATQQSGRYWKEQKKRDASGDAANLRRVKLGILSLLLFGSIGGFVWYFLFVPSRLVVLPISVYYQSPLPVNGLAFEDIDNFRNTLKRNFVVEKTIAARHDSLANKDKFLQQVVGRLDELKPLGPSMWQKTFVVYFSAHGVVDEENEPCFLMSGSTPHDSSTWLRAESFIKAVQDHSKLQSADIILMLDSNRVRDCWHAGVVENHFAERISTLVSEIGNERLYVINSTSAGQDAYSAPELGGTIFGHFAALGLAGATGGPSVSLDDLVAYLETNVSEFARQFRHASQRPCLIKNEKAGKNFKVAYCIEPTIAKPDVGEFTSFLQLRNDEIKELWTKFEQCHAAGAYRFQPMLYASVGANLARLEELLIAGTEYNTQYSDTRRMADSGIEKLLGARDAFTNVATTAAVTSQFNAYRDQPNKAAFQAWREALVDPALDPIPPTDGRKACALAVWDWLTSLDEVKAEDIATAEQYLASAENDCVFLPSEVHYVRLLSKHLPWDARKDWKLVLPRAFQIHSKTRNLAAPEDVRSFYWIQDELDAMESPLRNARDKLFIGSDSAIDDANRTWETIDPIPDGSIVTDDATASDDTSQFGKIRDRQAAVTDAYRQRDASMAMTPLFARWAATSNQDIGSEEIDELVTATNSLATELDNGSLDAAVRYAKIVNESLGRMQIAYEEECKVCADSGDKAVAEKVLRDSARLLSFPISTPGKTYHNRLRDKLLRHRWTKPRNLSLDAKTGEAFANTQRHASDSVGQHPAAAILGSNTSELSKLGGEIRSHMMSISIKADELETVTQTRVAQPDGQREKPVAARRPLSKADQMCRWVATFAPQGGLDYVNDLWRYDHHFFLLWQAHRSLRDLWGPEPSDEVQSPFFVNAVGSCLAAAKTLYPPATPYRDALSATTDMTDSAITNWDPIECDALRLFDDVENAGLVRHSVKYTPIVDASDPLNNELELPAGTPAVFVRSWTKPFPWYAESRLTKVPLGRREPSTQRLNHAFEGASLKKEPNLWAVTLFRGHEKQTPLRADKGQGAFFIRPQPKQTTVTVLGNAGPKTEIMFVLDCSGSMGITQMNAAKNMLVRVTDLLKKNGGNCDLGLFVFGHRFAGEPKPNERNVNARSRIEYLVQLGPTEVTCDAIQRELRRVKAEGMTPLYKSILEAAGKFRGAPRKQMIVVTDGENGVLNQKDFIANQFAQNAINAINQSSINVDIIGLGVAASSLQKGMTISEFANKSQNVSYSNNPNIKDVEAEILRALGLSTYTVTPSGRRTYVLSTGDRWLSPELSPGNCRVAASTGGSEEVVLEGGEALEIEAGRRLMHRAYRPQDNNNDVEDNSQRVRFHTNIHTGSRFSISLQNLDASFTRRPKRALVLIRPDNKQDQEFIAHETEYEPKRPVPVLHYRLTGWPKSAKAMLEFSYLNQDPIGVRRVSLDLANRSLTQPFRRDVRLDLDVTPSHDGAPIRVNITEVHDPESKHFPLHLAFQPEPLTARHSIAKKSQNGTREVLHEYTIERSAITTADVGIQVTTPEERRVNWINLAPISIDVDHWSR